MRRIGNRDLPELDVDLPGDEAAPVPPPPPDPALVAAGLLVARALAAAGVTAGEAARDGAVCLVVLPADEWCRPAREHWCHRMRGGERYDDGAHGRDWNAGSWAAWSPEEKPRPHAERQGAETFASYVARGTHCVGFAAEQDWLPADLIQGADHRLDVPRPAAADVALIAAAVGTGATAETLSDAEAALLTPRLLRLASRPGQTAGAYVLRLRAILARQAAPPEPAKAAAAGGPRDAPTLDRLHGMDEAVAWGRQVASDVAALRAGKIGAGEMDRGCLLSGPPGTGKTMFARALAAACGIPLVCGSYGEWHGSGSGHQGDFLRAMRKSFAEARALAPSILLIDEVDSFPNRSALTHRWADYEIQVVNAVLAELDGVQGRAGVIVLGACNHPEKLDPALVRSGRIDRHIRIALPGQALARILREHLGGDLAGECLSTVALLAAGSSGADAERFVRGARRRARQAGRPMAIGDLVAEVGGPERPAGDLGRAAIHEAGHALAVCELRAGTLAAVSLAAGVASGGMTVAGGLPAHPLAGDIRREIVILLAGRAAEEALLGEPSAGAGGDGRSDLALATGLAAAAAAAFGLDAAASGLAWAGLPESGSLPRILAADRALAARVRTVLDGCYAESVALVRRRRGAVGAIANALLERRALGGAETAAIAARHPGAGAGGVP